MGDTQQIDTSHDASFAQTVAAAAPAEEVVGISFRINGSAQRLDVDPRTSLLDALREELQLTGAKKGCDHGQCGACTVHLDGRRVVSCLMPVVQADGRQVLTIERIVRL